jgi:hypothetical protein
MAINYKKVNEEIVKVARGLGYTIKMFDEKGSGPIATAENARYIELAPDGIMISVPVGNSSEIDEIYIYAGKKKDRSKFLSLIQKIKNIGHFNGLGMTIRTFETDKVSPAQFSDDARAAKAQAEEENL